MGTSNHSTAFSGSLRVQTGACAKLLGALKSASYAIALGYSNLGGESIHADGAKVCVGDKRELYYNINDNLKLTVGVRYTKDKKKADQIPSQLLLGGGRNNPSTVANGGPDDPYGSQFIGDITGGRVNSGYPAQDDINQSWGKFTGRVVLDWKPDIGFTDDSLIYASISRGYKGGGVNPPRIDFNPNVVQFQFLPQTFRPEYVNALEVGMKHSFNGGRFTLNATGFFYDYKDFQVSQIVDRIAYNENFNATSWGLELEAAWRPSRAFRVDGNLGYLRTRLGKGEDQRAIGTPFVG